MSLQQERLRVRRIVEILEQVATPAAKELLSDMGRRGAEKELRRMAQAALDRIKADK